VDQARPRTPVFSCLLPRSRRGSQQTQKGVQTRLMRLISFTLDDFLRAASFPSRLTNLVQPAANR
jgi:hypothetical protein